MGAAADEQEWLYAPDDLVGYFRIMRPIGAGGMAEVYLARDAKLGRKVALKVIKPQRLGSAEEVKRFIIEARITARFNHPHIITIHDVGQHEGRPCVALEYLEGESLRQRLDHEVPGIQETLRIARDVAEALVAAHEAGILHRDLKPENVMLGQDGQLRVVDFGLATVMEREAAGPTPRRARSSRPWPCAARTPLPSWSASQGTRRSCPPWWPAAWPSGPRTAPRWRRCSTP